MSRSWQPRKATGCAVGRRSACYSHAAHMFAQNHAPARPPCAPCDRMLAVHTALPGIPRNTCGFKQDAHRAASPGPLGALANPVRTAQPQACNLCTHLVLDGEVDEVCVDQHLVGRPQLRVVAEEQRRRHLLPGGQPGSAGRTGLGISVTGMDRGGAGWGCGSDWDTGRCAWIGRPGKVGAA